MIDLYERIKTNNYFCLGPEIKRGPSNRSSHIFSPRVDHHHHLTNIRRTIHAVAASLSNTFTTYNCQLCNMPYKCLCRYSSDWGEDCEKLESILARGDDPKYGNESGDNRIVLYHSPTSWKNAAVRAKIESYFHVPDEVVEEHRTY